MLQYAHKMKKEELWINLNQLEYFGIVIGIILLSLAIFKILTKWKERLVCRRNSRSWIYDNEAGPSVQEHLFSGLSDG